MIHGGAGELDQAGKNDLQLPWLQAISNIVQTGYKILKRGGTAMDTVETCVSLLEDHPLFNAGRGAVLNEHGHIELDAAIMSGKDLRAGAVAGISCVANPVKIARKLLEENRHVLLTADGAMKFAQQHGIKCVPESYLITDRRLQEYKNLKRKPFAEKRKHGTVGAVAMDKRGNLAAATSTGGLLGKKQGRIGDSPIIGAGVYADNSTCAVSATGHGEMFLRTVLAKHIADLIQIKHMNAATAARQAINYLKRKVNGRGGVIVIDKHGRCSAYFNTRTMIHGWIEHGGDLHAVIR